MDEIIQIKCPFDGAVLSVKKQPGIESKNVTCPVCKHKYPFSQFKVVVKNANNEDSKTEYPNRPSASDDRTSYGNGDDNTQYAGKEDGRTVINWERNLIVGKLAVIGTGISYQLKPGRNVIGRKASNSTADFQIDTAEKRNMSRDHIVIEVGKVPGKGFVHYLSLYKEKVNETFVGNERLLFGDRVILHHGDVIKLPDAGLKFEIPDSEATDI